MCAWDRWRPYTDEGVCAFLITFYSIFVTVVRPLEFQDQLKADGNVQFSAHSDYVAPEGQTAGSHREEAEKEKNDASQKKVDFVSVLANLFFEKFADPQQEKAGEAERECCGRQRWTASKVK